MAGKKLLDADELLHLAIEASNNNNSEKSIELLKQALDVEPKNAKVHYMLGAMHAEIGMYERAVQDMQKSVEIDEGLNTAHFQLGLLHITSGNVLAAEDAWSALDKLGDEHALFLFKRGILSMAADEFQQCINDLKLGIENNTENLPLNKDMKMLITQAEQALNKNNDDSQGEPPNSDNTSSHVFMTAYNEDDN